MMWRNGLMVLVLSAVSMSAQGVCDVQLSEPTVDFGPLYPERGGRMAFACPCCATGRGL